MTEMYFGLKVSCPFPESNPETEMLDLPDLNILVHTFRKSGRLSSGISFRDTRVIGIRVRCWNLI
jgi:hypothetical protein